MSCFFDTSALIKRYIDEDGSDAVEEILGEQDEIIVSPITKIECFSVIKRLLLEKAIIKKNYDLLSKEIAYDFKFFSIIDFSDILEKQALKLVDRYQLKPLDSIQLASCLLAKKEISYMVACDDKLIYSSKKEGLRIINPIKISNP
mgnify:CR=1 FL=1